MDALMQLDCVFCQSPPPAARSPAPADGAKISATDRAAAPAPAASSAVPAAEPPAPPPAPKLAEGPAALALIDQASTIYEPSSVPVIAPYLDHPDPAVRAAALDGFLRLGERGAAPLLRAAADLFELPPASHRRKPR